jgi:hypothetical protein
VPRDSYVFGRDAVPIQCDARRSPDRFRSSKTRITRASVTSGGANTSTEIADGTFRSSDARDRAIKRVLFHWTTGSTDQFVVRSAWTVTLVAAIANVVRNRTIETLSC